MLAVSLWLVIIGCPVAAQTTKLKVACPTTVGSMAVMTKEAKLFERHGLEVGLIIDVNYLKELEQGGFIKKLYAE